MSFQGQHRHILLVLFGNGRRRSSTAPLSWDNKQPLTSAFSGGTLRLPFCQRKQTVLKQWDYFLCVGAASGQHSGAPPRVIVPGRSPVQMRLHRTSTEGMPDLEEEEEEEDCDELDCAPRCQQQQQQQTTACPARLSAKCRVQAQEPRTDPT